MNTRSLMALVATVWALLPACTASSPFPPKATNNLSPTFHFEAWRDSSPTTEAGKADSGLKVELGGRIIQTSRNGKGIVIVAEQLPIVKHPVYGPAEPPKRAGDYEFAFLYPGELEPQDLKNGNRFVIVGTTSGRKPVVVNGVPKSEPFLVADCIHVWQTGRAEIAEFKEGVGGGYSPLPEKTYCVPQQ
jgi:starvation-inducible outer membrane lipoprotein